MFNTTRFFVRSLGKSHFFSPALFLHTLNNSICAMAGTNEQLIFASTSSSDSSTPSNRLGRCSNFPNSERSSNEMNFSRSRQRTELGLGGRSFRDVDISDDDDMPHELKIIDDMGNFKCVKKSTTMKRRPSQLQRYFHTKTRLLPEFSFTQERRALVCPTEKTPSINSIVAQVACSGNTSSRESAQGQRTDETKAKFNRQNPFNLDLNALSEYQRRKHEREKLENLEHYQTIASKMKTKALEKKMLQAMRNEKFQLPKLFRLDDGELNELGVLGAIHQI